MRALLDVNVLVALLDQQHVHHQSEHGTGSRARAPLAGPPVP